MVIIKFFSSDHNSNLPEFKATNDLSNLSHCSFEASTSTKKVCTNSLLNNNSVEFSHEDRSNHFYKLSSVGRSYSFSNKRKIANVSRFEKIQKIEGIGITTDFSGISTKQLSSKDNTTNSASNYVDYFG